MSKSLSTFKIISFILLLFVSTAFGKYSFDQWTTDEGLPHNSIRQMVQTPNGYLWITTFDGLVRFDGFRFTIFTSVNTKEITDNRFLDAFAEDDGTLWASMLNGSIIRYKDGKFTSFQITKDFKQSSTILFRKDKNGKLIITTGRKNKRKSFHLIDDELVLAPKEYQGNNFWLYSDDEKHWSINNEEIVENDNEQITKYPLSVKTNFTTQVNKYNFFEDKKGALWIGDGKLLHKLSDGEIETYKVPESFVKDSDNDQPHASPALEDEEGGIWVKVISGDKALMYRFKDGEVDFSEKNLVREFDKWFGFVFKDKEGFIWFGSLNGIFRLRKHLIKTILAEEGIERCVYPIFERKNGEKLIGSNKFVDIYNDEKLTFLSGETNYRAFEEDKDGRLWVGSGGVKAEDNTQKRQLVVYDNGKEKDLTNLLGKSALISVIKADSKGNVWVGTNRGLFQIRDDKLVRHYTREDGLSSNNVNAIHESMNGQLWLGTIQGIIILKDGEFSTYTTEDGLTGNRIRTFYEDKEGVIWIGTYGNGLSRFKDGKFANFTTENGLYHNGAFQILEDDNENFWIGGNRGIYRVAKRELNLYAEGKISRVNSFGYGKADGMVNEEVNGGRQPAGIKANDGKLWFPTMLGVAIIDPNNMEYNQNVPKALIENVTIEREKQNFSDGIMVGVGKDDLEIHYTAPSFIKPEQIRFKYKLEGFNDDWVDADTRRTAYFSYLPPGNYTFRLLVANSDGIWSKQETTLPINVKAPFYKTNWFMVSVVLGIIGLIFLLYSYRVKQFERQNALQRAFSQKLLALQEDERRRIAAGLHDSLGQHLIIIKNWATLALGAMDKKSPARKEIKEISDTSLQALNEVREIINNLRPHQIETAGLTETIKTMIEQVESASGINFEFEYDRIEHLLNKEDEVTFYRIIQEYINNIVKHSNATNAFVSIRNGSNRIKVIIFDDGKGFDLENTSQHQNGFGLTGIQERLKMLGGEQTIRTEPGKGTSIHIRIELS